MLDDEGIPEAMPEFMPQEPMPGGENLLPTLLQIFITVALGWAAGSMSLFSQQEARGLGIFVGKFSLPSLIFISLASLNLSNIKWSFLLAVLVAKSIIFFVMMTLDYIINRNISRAALFGIYSTQTNDFGIGLPILNTVYGADHPLVALLYLVAPISLLILNPIGFVLLEVDKEKGEKDPKDSPLKTVLGVVKGLATNPVVAMTVLGVLGNLVFSSSPPPHLAKFLSALGAAFSSLAPFSLGVSMTGKLSGIRGDRINSITALVTVKSIVTPIVTYMVVERLTTLLDGASDPALSNFSLLLGSFPTALGVATYASEYGVVPDLISAAIVIGTLASAPLLFLVANTLTALSLSPEELDRVDHSWIDNILSISSLVIVLSLILSRPAWWRSQHLITMTLLLLTLVSSTAGLHNAYQPHPALALIHLTALHASRLVTPGLAIHIVLLTRLPKALTHPITIILLLLTGPLLSLSTLLLLLTPYSPHHHSVYGPMENHLTLTINMVALFPTVICLMILGKTSEGANEKEATTKKDLKSSLLSHQMFRHTLLLLAFAISMFTSCSVALARILVAGTNYPGAFKALNCINALMSSGQGIIFFLVFGLDQIGLLLIPFKFLGSLILLTWNHSYMVGCFVLEDITTVAKGLHDPSLKKEQSREQELKTKQALLELWRSV